MKVLSIIVLSLLVLSCVKNKNYKNSEPEIQTQAHPDMPGPMASNHVVKVEEVIHGSTYTYLLVSEKNQKNWLAISKMEIEVGDDCYYEKALKMENFTSKELDKTFDVIYFVSQLSKDPLMVNSSPAVSGHMGKAPSTEKESISIEKPEGEHTIAELFINKDSFAGKTVKITGKLVKINTGIMDRNWLHLQDGTSDNGNFDLTITSQDIAVVGEIITVKGTLAVDKDFGAGYSYNLIIENATIETSGKEI